MKWPSIKNSRARRGSKGGAPNWANSPEIIYIHSFFLSKERDQKEETVWDVMTDQSHWNPRLSPALSGAPPPSFRQDEVENI